MVAATLTTTTITTSIATTCKVKSIEMKISRSICTYTLSKGHSSNVVAMGNCMKLKLPGLDERDVLLTKRQIRNTAAASNTTAIQYYYIVTTTVTTITTMPKGRKKRI